MSLFKEGGSKSCIVCMEHGQIDFSAQGLLPFLWEKKKRKEDMKKLQKFDQKNVWNVGGDNGVGVIYNNNMLYDWINVRKCEDTIPKMSYSNM